MNLINMLNNAVVEVMPTRERYRVHYLNLSNTFEFEHIEWHKAGHMNNTAKDKVKEIDGVHGVRNLLLRRIIVIVERAPMISNQKLTEINL